MLQSEEISARNQQFQKAAIEDLRLLVPDAPTALEMLASNPVDTLLTDVGLPRVSGTVLARQARAKSKNLRIIIVTGDAGAAQDAREIGATLLTKPYQSADLARVLD